MTPKVTFREWLQGYLGILSHEKQARLRHVAQNDAAVVRHQETLAWVSGIHERLGKLENVFADNHVKTRRQAVESYDWEQIQYQRLEEMMKNIPKEDYDD